MTLSMLGYLLIGNNLNRSRKKITYTNFFEPKKLEDVINKKKTLQLIYATQKNIVNMNIKHSVY